MKNKITFSLKVKEEISDLHVENKSHIRSLLSAFIRNNAAISFENKVSRLTLQSESAHIARFIYTCLEKTYGVKADLIYKKNEKLNKTTSYLVTFLDEDDTIQKDLAIDILSDHIPSKMVKNDEDIAAYLAGSFLASGSINSPITSDYHLEMSFSSEDYARDIISLFDSYSANNDFHAKLAARRNKYIVYMKRSDKISDFLIMIGAINSCMEYENVRIDRDYVNVTNRLTNFDVSNMNRTVKTAEEQVNWIKRIDKEIGISNLSKSKLRLVAEYRLANESASMQDIADMMSQTLNKKISKSNVAHLFRELKETYERLVKLDEH